MTNEEIAKTLGMTVEQVEAITRHASNVVRTIQEHREEKAKPIEPKTDDYGYIITEGTFETFVSWREADDRVKAIQVAYQPLQAWYCHGGVPGSVNFEAGCRVINITRSQYVDWLRSHE